MSEYQYYEFQAIDRPLGEADMRALGGLSTRARITATSFVNHYNWGDFGGNPENMMERWFDLHLYLANWGTRRLMIRVPKRFLDRSRLKVFLREVDGVQVRVSGRNLIVDIWSEDEEYEYDHLDDGPGLLGAMAPLRSDLLSGDLRLFYLLWLTAVEAGDLEDDENEPLPGIGPLTGSLEAFGNFFHIDPDLVQVAAEVPLNADLGKVSAAARRRAVEAIPHAEKTAFLGRLVDGDPHVMVELQRKVREAVTEPRRRGARQAPDGCGPARPGGGDPRSAAGGDGQTGGGRTTPAGGRGRAGAACTNQSRQAAGGECLGRDRNGDRKT